MNQEDNDQERCLTVGEESVEPTEPGEALGQDYDTQSELSLEMSEDHFGEEQSDETTYTTKYQLELAISRQIKLLRMESTEEMKRKLVMKICELRILMNEINEQQDLLLNGHKLVGNNFKNSSALVCECCLKKPKIAIKILSNIRNGNQILVCQFCGYQVHEKCQVNITRKCPKILDNDGAQNSEKNFVILKICPEIGLSAQQFQCADCKSQIFLETSKICDYSGLYYCNKCHWGEDLSVTPARVIHNWDFVPRPVSRQSLQVINYIRNKPTLFNITELNSMLYGLVEELANLKKIRCELAQMIRYTRICKQPNKPKLVINNYLVEDETANFYSLNDLSNLQVLFKVLLDAHETLTKHITKECVSCYGKGFFCELCKDKDNILFPFLTSCSTCAKCSAVYHKNCYHRKGKKCPRCERLNLKRELSQQNDISENDLDENSSNFVKNEEKIC